MTKPKAALAKTSGRFYPWPPEAAEPEYLLPSVTTILDVLNKPALMPWAIKEVTEFVIKNNETVHTLIQDDPDAARDLLKRSPYRRSSKASFLGDEIHGAVENYVKGKPQDEELSEKAQEALDKFVSMLTERDFELIASERTVYNLTVGYSGTFDLIANLDGKVTFMDIKTGKGVYPEVALQLAAYAYAEFIGNLDGTTEPIPTIEQFQVMHLRPDGISFKDVFIVPEIFETFKAMRQVYEFTSNLSKSVLK